MNIKDKQAKEKYLKHLELIRSASNVNPFETKIEQKEAIDRAKQDYAFMVERYFPHWAGAKTPDFHIKFVKKVKKNKTYKGGAWWGRALAKSTVVNTLFPFWLWINGEPVYHVVIGSSHDKAKQLLDDLRAEFEANPQIIKDFGKQHNLGSWEDGFFITKGGFIGQALGAGQNVRGLRVKDKRPTLLTLDDIETKELNKNEKRQNELVQWVERDLIPTMDGDYRRFIQANNRYAHKMVQTKLAEKHPDWDLDIVNAYDPVTYEPTWKSKYTADYFRQVEKEIGVLASQAEYNNTPHVEGAIFMQEHIQWGKLPALNKFDIICGTWDVAYAGTSSADYNAVVIQGLFKNRDFWEIDCFVKQCKMRDAVAYMCDFQKNLPKTVIIHWLFEAQFWNDEVERTIREVEKEFKVHLNIVKTSNPKTRKYDRILSMHPSFQNGRSYFDENKKAHQSTQVGLSQLFGIEPNYKGHDDYPDAKEMGKSFLEKHIYINSDSANFTLGKMQPNNQRI